MKIYIQLSFLFINLLIFIIITVDRFASSPFLPMDPLGALQSRFFNDVPLIIGHNKHEFAHVILPYLKNQTNLRHFLNNWAISGPAILFNRY